MTQRNRVSRDAFRFSLGGINRINGFGVSYIVADDRINQAISAALAERPATDPGDSSSGSGGRPRRWGRFWLGRRHQPA